MIPRPIKDIDQDTLQSLIDDAVPEGKTIDYKVDFPGKAESSRVPLLASVASFANTAGGDLLLGVEEEEGLPVGLPGIEIEDLDTEILSLEHMLLNGLVPRLPAIEIHPVETGKRRYVLVIRVSQSWIAPHRVTRNSKFYGRNSRGRHELDVGELRMAFTMSEGIADRIREFRIERIGRIQSERTPVPLESGGRMVLHVFPRTAFSVPTAIDMATLEVSTHHVPPMGCTSWDYRVNLDGFLTFIRYHDHAVHAYSQLFRTGALESVSALRTGGGPVHLPSVAYEQDVIRTLTDYLKVADSLNLEPPYYGFLSLLGVKGGRLVVQQGRGWPGEDERYTVEEDVLNLPEIVIEEQAAEPTKIMRPLFDMVWNAFGFSRSFNYDEQGNWSG